MTGDSKTNWVMVTGATGGIGSALVDRLAKRGFSVIASAREPSRLPQFAGPGRVVGLKLDLEQPSTVEAATGEIARTIGGAGLHGLVNMAGVIVEGPLEIIPPSEFRRQLEINVVGPFALTQALLPQLKQARGIVVNIGAISAHLTVPFYGPIAASKSALASLNDAMRLEFAQFGVKVFLIEPGAMMTGIFSTSRPRRDADLSNFPEAERRYRPALAAFDRAFQKAGADDPKVVADAVMKAFAGRGMKPRAVVGKGTGALLLLSRLPIRLRDRMVKSALGLSGALNPAG
ncbi:MAG: SDR family NAD(P)-dependent oxidoreductase [Roseiarcus sp.]|uniref:SDR family NAD(P)-dependent oxidoreductase n=1 Tax=Roseiarcus sp. TaxID=1969460 RepID=UPI003C6B435A